MLSNTTTAASDERSSLLLFPELMSVSRLSVLSNSLRKVSDKTEISLDFAFSFGFPVCWFCLLLFLEAVSVIDEVLLVRRTFCFLFNDCILRPFTLGASFPSIFEMCCAVSSTTCLSVLGNTWRMSDMMSVLYLFLSKRLSSLMVSDSIISMYLILRESSS